MTKTTSIVLFCIITAIVLFFGVFAFLSVPDGLDYGTYGEFYSAYDVIQKSGLFTDTTRSTYQTKLNEGVDFRSVQKTINARLQSIYGYYSIDISNKDGLTTIVMPKTAPIGHKVNTSRPSAASILSSVTAVGKVEVLSTAYSQDAKYEEDKVLLSEEHFRRARTQTYAQADQTFYICEVKLTDEGAKLASKNLTENSQYVLAVDNSVATFVVYTNGGLQIYSASNLGSKTFASYIKNGALGAELTLDETGDIDVVNKTSWVYAAVMGVIVLATFVFFAVRYKTLGLAGMLSQLMAIVLFMYISMLLYMVVYFNLFAAIGLTLAYAFMTFFTIFTFEKIRAYNQEKTFSSSAHKGFATTNKISLIAHAALLVLGIILWVIPTAVTAPMGTMLVFGAVLSFIATFGLNRLFVKMIEPFYETTGRANAKK